MPLTPATNDPNRKKELQRKKKDPDSFGTDSPEELPKDWKPNNLKTTSRKEEK